MDGTDRDYLVLNTDEKLVFTLNSGTWNDGNLYFSSTTTPGNNNLVNTGTTNNAAGVDSIMIIDGADSSPTFTLVDLDTYGNLGGMPDNTWTLNYMDSTHAASSLTAIYLKSAAKFKTATGKYKNANHKQSILKPEVNL